MGQDIKLIEFTLINITITLCYFVQFGIASKIWNVNELKKVADNTMTENQVNKKYEPIKILEDMVNIRILFISLCMGIIFLALSLFYYYSNKYSNNILFSTGILLPFLLWSMGMIIRKLFKNLKKILDIKSNLEEEDKNLIILVTTILCSLIANIYKLKFSLIVLSIIIGKYLWIDSEGVLFLLQIREMIKKSSNLTKTLLIFYCTMIFMANIFYWNTKNMLISIVGTVVIIVGVLTFKYEYKKNERL